MRNSLNNKMFGAMLLSGALSGVTFVMVPDAPFVGPGILFGAATSWVFMTSKWFGIREAFIWFIASTAAWYTAVHVYITSSSNWPSGDPLRAMLLAGLVGSLILVLVFTLLLHRIHAKNIILTILISVALAAVMNEILASGSGTELSPGNALSYTKLAVAFAIWQVGVGLSLLSYNPKQQH